MEIFDEKTKKFLRENKHLGENVVLLGYGGSHAYGTSTEESDIDIRGVATRTADDILTGKDFQQVCHEATDTVVYSFDKMVHLLCNCNPNIIEMLGLKPEHYFYVSPAGRMLLDNRHIFLTKKAIASFGGYATAQLRRLENKAAGKHTQAKYMENILKTLISSRYYLDERYAGIPEGAVSMYLGNREGETDKEIFLNVHLDRYPLNDFSGIINEMNAIAGSYNKFGHRNQNAVSRAKLGKHMMHLIRLYLMCFDILEKGEIITYREKERDFLLSIRNGAYLDEHDQPTKEFYKILDELENKLEKMKITSDLPDRVDMEKVEELVKKVNRNVMEG